MRGIGGGPRKCRFRQALADSGVLLVPDVQALLARSSPLYYRDELSGLGRNWGDGNTFSRTG
jgi:hypothetical protein